MKRLSCLTFTAITLLVGAQLAAAAPPTIGILLDGKGLSAETELSIRDAIDGKGLKVIARKTLRAATAFAPKGAKGWDKASLTALKDASGATYLLFVKAKPQGARVAIMISLFHNSSVESKVISAGKSAVDEAVQKAIGQMLPAAAAAAPAAPAARAAPAAPAAPAPRVRTFTAAPAGKAWFGITMKNVRSGGVLIQSVDPGSAAQRAGIKPGDIIAYLGQVPTPTYQAFLAAMKPLSPGTNVVVLLRRMGTDMAIPVTLGTRPAAGTAPSVQSSPSVRSSHARRTQAGGPFAYRLHLGVGGFMTIPDPTFVAGADFWLTAGMRNGFQIGLQNTLFIEAGVFQHWVHAGIGGGSWFFGVGMVGNHGVNVSNNLNMSLLYAGKTRPNEISFSMGYSVVINFDAGAGYQLWTFGVGFGN